MAGTHGRYPNALLEHRSQYALELGRLPREAQIGGVRPIDGALVVRAEQMVGLQVRQVRNLVALEFSVNRAHGHVVGLISLAAGRVEEIVGYAVEVVEKVTVEGLIA